VRGSGRVTGLVGGEQRGREVRLAFAQVVGFLSRMGKGGGRSLAFAQMAASLVAWSKCKRWVVVHVRASGQLLHSTWQGGAVARVHIRAQVVGLLAARSKWQGMCGCGSRSHKWWAPPKWWWPFMYKIGLWAAKAWAPYWRQLMARRGGAGLRGLCEWSRVSQ
jgi:hypothetical protein